MSELSSCQSEIGGGNYKYAAIKMQASLLAIIRHHLNLSETAMSYCIAAAADFLTTEPINKILSIMRNRKKMVD